MTDYVQSTDLRRNIREILGNVQGSGEAVIVRTYGNAQAVLIPYEDFEAYQDWKKQQKKRAAWLNELQTIAEEVSARANLSEEDFQTLMEEGKEACQET